MTAIPLLAEIDELARAEIIREIEKWKLSAGIELPSVWAEENRYLPQGVSNLPGKINHAIAPHMVEICDNFHPHSGIQCTTVMKSTQSLATTTIEHVIGWAIKNKLHNILYVISSKGMAKMRSSAAIDVLIDYSGLAQYVKPISSRMKRKTADNTFYKEFSGGFRLMMTSWNSIADAKSFSWDLLVFDEIDEAPFELKGQGDPEKLFEVRGITARHLKIAKISTPTTTHGRIYKNFMDGDRRYFFMKCPLCGEEQVLELLIGGNDYGLTARAETIDGIEQIIPESVHYICKSCKKYIYEYQKQDMLMSGRWKPTARPVNPAYRSYHISNLMSPIMFYTWTQVMQAFSETEWGQRITRYKSFIINILGMPWEAKTEKKDYQELIKRAEEYKLGEMPPGALMPIAGFDVHKKHIECVAVGFGRDMECWVIDHKKFYAEGETRNKDDRCWTDFRNYVLTKKFKMKHIEVPLAIAPIDSGYNPDSDANGGNDITSEHTVYEIVARTSRTVACRGNTRLKDAVVRQERVKRQSPLKTRYDVATNELKDELFVKIDMPPGAPGAIHFSKNLSEEFFKGFLSEVFTELEPGKWGYKKIYEHNHPLDCFLLCRAGAEILNLPAWSKEIWDEYEKKILK
jgi:phage terminase large subunit GpA-like protein